MTYHIQSFDHNVICVRYSGLVTMEERTAVVNELCSLKQHSHPFRLLIDLSPVKHKMTTLEQTIFAKYLVSLEEFEFAHIALLSKKSKVPKGLIDISVLQANLRFKEFDNEPDALNWLKD